MNTGVILLRHLSEHGYLRFWAIIPRGAWWWLEYLPGSGFFYGLVCRASWLEVFGKLFWVIFGLSAIKSPLYQEDWKNSCCILLIRSSGFPAFPAKVWDSVFQSLLFQGSSIGRHCPLFQGSGFGRHCPCIWILRFGSLSPSFKVQTSGFSTLLSEFRIRTLAPFSPNRDSGFSAFYPYIEVRASMPFVPDIGVQASMPFCFESPDSRFYAPSLFLTFGFSIIYPLLIFWCIPLFIW